MGALECAGCAFIGFSPAFAMFVFIIARDPLRIILFVAGAFFWLLSLLISSLLWYAVVPLRERIEFGLFFSIAFQELFRWFYFLVIKKAERGLEKVSAQGMHIEGVHSLKNAKNTTALVCGLGFGVMAGAFALVNVLADLIGPGTIGLPVVVGLQNIPGDYKFFLVSSVIACALILLHVMWNIIFWYGCEHRKYWMIALVVLSHFLISGLTLLNGQQLQAVPITFCYVVLALFTGWSYIVVGGSVDNLRQFVVQLFTCSFPPKAKNSVSDQQQVIQQPTC